MRKEEELKSGCMARAFPWEMTFVLLGRDVAAPGAIREWCRLRVLHGKNAATDPQITGALECAHTIEWEQAEHRYLGPRPMCHHDEMQRSAPAWCSECERERSVAEEFPPGKIEPFSGPARITCNYCGTVTEYWTQKPPEPCNVCRDRFAMAALQMDRLLYSYLAECKVRSADSISDAAYEIADAMMKRRLETQ